MQYIYRTLITSLVAISVAAPVVAQTMKPGLWEVTTQMQGGLGGNSDKMAKAMEAMRAQLANMPADKRKAMEDMMAKQGVQMAPGADGMAMRVCLTPEMVARKEVVPPQKNCTHSTTKSSAQSMQFAFTCTNPERSGEGEVNFTSPEAYTMKMTARSKGKGEERSMDMKAQGKFINSDCGNINPLAIPKQ